MRLPSDRHARGCAWASAFEARFWAEQGVAPPIDVHLTGLDSASPAELDAPYFIEQEMLVSIGVVGGEELTDFLDSAAAALAPIANPSNYAVLAAVAQVCLRHHRRGQLIDTFAFDVGIDLAVPAAPAQPGRKQIVAAVTFQSDDDAGEDVESVRTN
jgi:hypothetical protein